MLSLHRPFNLLGILTLVVIATGCSSSKATTGPFTLQEMDERIRNKETGFYADFFDDHVWMQGEQIFYVSDVVERITQGKVEAKALNKHGQVPDAEGWFSNRNGRAQMSDAELRKGANKNEGPSTSAKWVVTKGKIQGRTPGFYIRDSKGDRYLIKLDVKDYPEMASSAEVVGSKFFHAIGYNVPQYTITYFAINDLTVDESATLIDENGFEKKLTLENLKEKILGRAYVQKDGRYRSSASLLLEGIPKGYFSFNSRRPNDPDDVARHRYRREARGLRVFSAWLNHNDIRRGNTLDMLVEKNGHVLMKHYLIDFGSMFGSQTIREKWSETSNEYIFDLAPIVKTALGLGIFYQRPWSDTSHVIYPSIGYITSENFDPKKWKQEIPNFAFKSMTGEDARWAAEIVGSFTDDQIRILVETGKLSDPEAEKYLVDTLIARRDKVVNAWSGSDK